MAAMLGTHQDRIAAHMLARSCPDEYENACEATPGMDIDMARKPDSTWYSIVKVFKERVTVIGGDGAARGPTSEATLRICSALIGSEVTATQGSVNAAGTLNADVLPLDISNRDLCFRNIGMSCKFTPTQKLDDRAGEVGMVAFSTPFSPDPTSMGDIRDYPWAQIVPFPAGAHLDIGHSGLIVPVFSYLQGGNGVPYDASQFTMLYNDPDKFTYHAGGGAVMPGKFNNRTFATWPSAPGAGTAVRPTEIFGTALMHFEGITATAADTVFGTLDIVRIVELCLPNQTWTPKPITWASRPSTQIARKQENKSDLQYIVSKTEAAGGWLAENWRGVLKTGVGVAGGIASAGSVLGIPGMGAVNAAIDVAEMFM